MSGQRVAVADDGRQVVMKVYYGNTAFDVILSPLRAVNLARRLLEAAEPKLVVQVVNDE